MDDSALAAYHEAGHVVAAVKRGSAMPDDPFVAWAGPWAQARAEWHSQPLVETHDEFGFEDRAFEEYLVRAYPAATHDDRPVVEQHFASLPWPSMRAASERVWGAELAPLWPVIELVAAWLLAEVPVTGQRVRELIEQLNAHPRSSAA